MSLSPQQEAALTALEGELVRCLDAGIDEPQLREFIDVIIQSYSPPSQER